MIANVKTDCFLKVCDRTTSPEWNEAFCFLVQDPREDILVLKVCWLQWIFLKKWCIFKRCFILIVFLQLSHSWTLPIGSLVVPIRELLSEPELVLDQWFNLDGASPESQILLRAELKVSELCFLSMCVTVVFHESLS